MKPLISLFSFYIKSSIHVALGVTGLVYVTSIEFGVTLPVAFYWVSFLGTITGYNFIKYAEIAGLQHKSLIKSLQNLQVFSLSCVLFAGVFSNPITPCGFNISFRAWFFNLTVCDSNYKS